MKLPSSKGLCDGRGAITHGATGCLTVVELQFMAAPRLSGCLINGFSNDCLVRDMIAKDLGCLILVPVFQALCERPGNGAP